MHFFTRQFHKNLQAKPGSRTEAKAEKDWKSNSDLYRIHFKSIAGKLPSSAREFAKYSFHDAELLETHFGQATLSFLLDTRGCFTISTPRARLTFEGVHDYSQTLPRKDEWWLYEELHLAESGFSLHVLFDETDFQITAERVFVEFFI
jgi:hypothetical protein